MNYEIRKPLKKLSNKELLHDVKKYIKNTHEFFRDKNPEMDVMAKRLHEEYSLNDFYKVFNRLWNSGSNEERSLAIHSLILYNENFDTDTWRFIKLKLRDVKSIDDVKFIAEIIFFICLRYSSLKNEIVALSLSYNIWMKRISVFSCYYLIKRKKINGFSFVLKIIRENVYDRDEEIQKALIFIVNETGRDKKEEIKKLILKHRDMPENLFLEFTRNMKYLRKLKKIHKL